LFFAFAFRLFSWSLCAPVFSPHFPQSRLLIKTLVERTFLGDRPLVPLWPFTTSAPQVAWEAGGPAFRGVNPFPLRPPPLPFRFFRGTPKPTGVFGLFPVILILFEFPPFPSGWGVRETVARLPVQNLCVRSGRSLTSGETVVVPIVILLSFYQTFRSRCPNLLFSDLSPRPLPSRLCAWCPQRGCQLPPPLVRFFPKYPCLVANRSRTCFLPATQVLHPSTASRV